MTAEYPQKTITLEPEMQERLASLVDEIKGPMPCTTIPIVVH
jgi:hypothetical protein